MKKFYFIAILLLVFGRMVAQDCSALQFTYSINESRCVATGSIEVMATGGSGNYNYRAIGPVSTPFTSSSLITGLSAGYYSVLVTDLTTGCSKQIDSALIPGSYSDPRFQLVKTDASCAGNDGIINVTNAQFGRAPFIYSIIAPSPSSVGVSNTSGTFSGLIPGEYSIQLTDSCGGIQVRYITIENYDWWFDSTSVAKTDCDNAQVFFRIRDNKGNENTSGNSFNGFTYGVVINTNDTVWNTTHSFSVLLGNNRNLVLVVKDDCGSTKSTTWSLPQNQRPDVGPAALSYFTCTDFTVSINGQQNLTSPEFCLYDASDTMVECNSTGIFSGLGYGSYCIKVSDLCYDTVITRCFTANAPEPSVDASVSVTDQDCLTFTAAISGQLNLINPEYCLLNETNDTLECNTTGIFNGLLYNSNYCILIKNGCSDTTISRCFIIEKEVPLITGHSITNADCSYFDLSVGGDNLVDPLFCLYDTLGTLIACDSSGTFTGIEHGAYCIRAISCGDTTASYCFTSTRPQPSVSGWVNRFDKTCTGFRAVVDGQTNLTNPEYCLYNSSDSLLDCNNTGIFENLAYGSYCIHIKDSCTDSTIVRCFTEEQVLPEINQNIQQSNITCTDFTATITGNNFTDPEYCVYDEANNLIACNTNGVFHNLEYGTYCFTVKDGCIDTTLQLCKTFTTIKGITVSSSKSCTLGNTDLTIQFANSNGPYQVKIFHPNGLPLFDTITSINPFRILMPDLPEGTQYKIVGIDDCNQKDTSFVTPNASEVTKSTSIRSKCPTGIWTNGAGDLLVHCSSNFYATRPSVIKKDGNVFNRSYSSVADDLYTFADLEPATYIVKYDIQSCNTQLYDTITVEPYAYPTQGQSAVYQCDNSSLSLGANVQGGVAPFSYQIIGSTPESPSIVTAAQSSSVFSINTGTVYSLVRMRAVDACGNATLDDVSVLPLQNISVTASQECYYQNITLSVDSVHNASYEWYRKTSPADSTLVGEGSSFNLPFFVPEETGEYICKMSVNNGCLLRTSSFTLDGNCNNLILPVSIQLQGQKINAVNQLSWMAEDDRSVSSYIVQRKGLADADYRNIGSLKSKNAAGINSYHLSDRSAAPGKNMYRVKIIYTNHRVEYSNVIILSDNASARVYPNPVKEQLHINLTSTSPADFTIELYDIAGRKLFMQDAMSVINSTFIYRREPNVGKGLYIIKIINRATGIMETHKVIMN